MTVLELFDEQHILAASTCRQLEHDLQSEFAKAIKNEGDPLVRHARMVSAIKFFARHHDGFDARAFATACGHRPNGRS
ncbi:MAG: hypothetical protein IT536_08280 [Hyphomicrobiales bacterium]|nr:hypothetical protein [Hyphomicrobiales bacterium]